MLNIGEGSSKYVTFWEAKDEGKYAKGRVSSSSKKQDGTYENSNWFVNFVGEAKDKSLTLHAKDKIEITKGGMSSVYSKEKDTTYFNMVIFDFEVMGDGNTAKPSKASVEVENDFNSDDIPF